MKGPGTGADIVIVPDHIFSPCFINAYDQLSYDHHQDWFSGYRGFTRLNFYQDRDIETLAFNELRHLAGGATSILDELAVVYAFNEKLPKKAAFSDREIWRMVTANPARLLDVSR